MAIANDGSIRDQRLLGHIEKELFDTESELIVRFVDHAKRDHKAEAAQQQRIQEGANEIARPFFKRAVYIEKRFKGQIDHIAKPATDADKREHAREWERFQASAGRRLHSIRLLPGNDVCTQAIFDELRIENIEDFITFSEQKPETLEIFTELRPLLEVAKRWRTFMKPRLKLVDGEIQ